MSPGLYSYPSNRLECLAVSFARIFGDKMEDPLAPTWVVVPNAGVARWLSFQLADQCGISCNYDFLFPGHFVERLAGLIQETHRQPLSVRDWVWSIYEILGNDKDLGKSPLGGYLEDGDDLKRMQLAFSLARFFDQICLYRYDRALAWEQEDEPSEWQGRLWKKLCHQLPDLSHPARYLETFRQGCISGNSLRFPRRMAFFAVSALPPLYWEFICAASRSCEVHLFYLQPSSQYYGDHRDPQRQARQALRQPDVPERGMDEGNPLLATWGAQGRDFLNQLVDLNFNPQEEQFVREEEGTLLQQVQNDIWDDCDRSLPRAEKLHWECGDNSLNLAVCHSPLREVEVLYDVILDALEKDRKLRPRDILVLTPSMGDYAPLIEAVFGVPEDPNLRLPYSLADRSPQSELPLVDVLLRIVEVAGGRLTSRDIMELLESSVFRERFRLEDEDLAMIRRWIMETGIRWGLDARTREVSVGVKFEENSWSFGIKRLMLGLAVPRMERPFAGIMPYPELEGDRLEILERFLEAFSVLEDFFREVAQGCDLKKWIHWLKFLLQRITPEADEYNRSRLLIQDALLALERSTQPSETRNVPVQAMHYFLQRYFSDSYRSGGFLNGGITFAELTPLRAVPAKMICVLGLNDQAFPRHEPPSAFRLENDSVRPGDRDIRKQDQYLFLETLLSARRRLYLSYTGFSLRDPGKSPPSVLVAQLFDYLERAVAWPDERRAKVLVTEHAMTGFSPFYFKPDSQGFSYSKSGLAGARALMGRRDGETESGQREDLEVEDADDTVALDDLFEAISDPTNYFAKRTLGIRGDDSEDPLPEDEPMKLDWLEVYLLKSRLLCDEKSIRNFESQYERERALGTLPVGGPGKRLLIEASVDLDPLLERRRNLVGEYEERYQSIELRLGEKRLQGEVGPIYGETVVLMRPAKTRAKDLLRGWLFALVLSCLSENDGRPRRVVVLSTDSMDSFIVPVDSAEKILLDLIQLRAEAMRRALPLFPISSYEYAHACFIKEKNTSEALSKVVRQWEGNEEKAERCKGFYPLFWRRAEDVFGESFVSLAKRLWKPVFKYLKAEL